MQEFQGAANEDDDGDVGEVKIQKERAGSRKDLPRRVSFWTGTTFCTTAPERYCSSRFPNIFHPFIERHLHAVRAVTTR